MTYREQFDSAMKCTTKEEAQKWLSDEVIRYQMDYSMPAPEAKQVILINLGYMAGYGDGSEGRKVLDLFGAAHPIFGEKYLRA